jgi:hypothetical protein
MGYYREQIGAVKIFMEEEMALILAEISKNIWGKGFLIDTGQTFVTLNKLSMSNRVFFDGKGIHVYNSLFLPSLNINFCFSGIGCVRQVVLMHLFDREHQEWHILEIADMSDDIRSRVLTTGKQLFDAPSRLNCSFAGGGRLGVAQSRGML